MKRWIQAIAAVVMLIGLIAPAISHAQDAPAKPERKTEAKDGRIALPFEFEGLMFVQVKVNGKGPYKFLFDSGATTSVLNERLTKELGLEQHDMPGGGGVQGVGTAEAKMVVLDNVEMGDYARGKCVAASMNFDHMSGGMGYHMMGIIGQNIMRMIKVIEIDFAESMLYFTEYAASEMPRDQDEMIISMLEGGGAGIPGIPGIPGLPGGPRERPRDPNEDDEFSVVPPMGQWFMQDGDRETTSTRTGPTEGQTIDYKTVSVPMLGELVPYWYVEAEVNGHKKTFMFDTGASMLLVFGKELATELKLTTSFGYPVKGIGKGDAHSGMVESFKIGNLYEEDLACTIMDLPKMSDQLPDMMKMMLPMLKRQGIVMDFDGILGVTLATRYHKMIVNTSTKKIEFVPYKDGMVNKLSPYSTEDFVKEAAIRTWHGQAGKFGLKGDAVQLDDWKKHGLETGGLMIEEVENGGAAHKAGLKKGDIITHLVGLNELMPEELEDARSEGEDVVVRDMPALIMLACAMDPGTEVTVRVMRDGKSVEMKVKLDKYGWEGTIPERWKR